MISPPCENEPRHVVEAALPSGVGRLLLAGEAGDVEAVGGDVVGRRAEGHHREQGQRVPEIARQRQAQRHQPQADPAGELQQDHEELLGLEHLQQRAPQRLERPGQQQQTGVERDDVVAPSPDACRGSPRSAKPRKTACPRRSRGSAPSGRDGAFQARYPETTAISRGLSSSERLQGFDTGIERIETADVRCCNERLVTAPQPF